MAESHDRQEEKRGENAHHSTEMREANVDVFESGATPRFTGQPNNGPAELDPDAVQGPGGDSRPDQTDAEGTKLENVAESPMMTTTREAHEPVEAHRARAEEYNSRRSDDNLEVIGQPIGPNDEEIAVLRENPGKRLDTEEP